MRICVLGSVERFETKHLGDFFYCQKLNTWELAYSYVSLSKEIINDTWFFLTVYEAPIALVSG